MDHALPTRRARRARTGAPAAAPDGLTALGQALVTRGSGRAASVRLAGVWAHVDIPGARLPEQGWKLHVSASESSAAAVLSAAVPVLLAAGVPFKFAASTRVVRMLNSATVDRGAGGKFLTAYPPDDAAAVRLADALAVATAGLTGPAILSDRPYRPGSLVHYRYGGFTGRRAIDADGVVVHLIRDPAGNLVPDARRPGQAAPPWVTDPFHPPASAPAVPEPGPAPEPGGPVLLKGRYLVRAALRHANKGGTYLAEDRLRDVPVIVKEGRPHVGAAADGDACDRIRHEAAMLGLLAGTGCVPGLVEVFDAGGHAFLVSECIAAPTLRDVVEAAWEPPAAGLGAPDAAALAVRLAAAVHAVHAAGVVLRDLNPANILVAPDGTVTLVDFEFAYLAGGEPPSAPAGTPGYAAPEQVHGRPAGFAGDYWSLGATIAFAATGADPWFPAELPGLATDPERVAGWLERLATSGRVDARLARLSAACMSRDPADRPGPDAVVRALTAEPPTATRPGLPDFATAGPAPSREHGRPSRRGRRDFGAGPEPVSLEDADPTAGVDSWLVANLGTGPDGHLWPAGQGGLALDPLNVQSGASGVGLYLCLAARHAPAARRTRLRHALDDTATWVTEQLDLGPRRTPALYFGLSGVAWFLAEAAEVLGRADLARRAAEIGLAAPLHGPNPDLAHGTAGIGLAQLRLWLATGDARFLDRAVRAADHLARTVDGHATWEVPTGAPTRFAGSASYGFAHGSAGIASFLLSAGAASGDDAFTRLGLDVLEALLPRAVAAPGGAAYWPAGPGRPELWPHWCNGASGVGTALLRGWLAGGPESFLAAAGAAAAAGEREAHRSSAVQCHGLAGDAELLLDLARLTAPAGDPETAAGCRARAEGAAAALWLRRTTADGHVVFPDESGAGVSAGLGTGLAGTGAFFTRLRVGTPRLLMLDDLLIRGRKVQ